MSKYPPGFYIETIHPKYTTDDPVFFDKKQFSWAADLERDYPKIMESLAPVFSPDFNGLMTNPEIHIQFPPKIWKGFLFYFNGIKSNKNLNQFPFVRDELKRIPHLINASITVLEPGAWLLPHNGSTNAVMRVHLPLKVPGQFPECGMTIAGHDISWKEGEVFMFCDMQVHSVRNLTKERRYILLLDVMRPEYIQLKQLVCVHTIARIVANVVRNFAKVIFSIPFKKQDPTKGEMKHVANKNYATEEEDKKRKIGAIDIGWFIAEKAIIRIMIIVLSVWFTFKKLQ